MFDLILKVFELVVNKLPDVDIAARKKRTFARSLMVLHECSIQIVENGREILDALDVYRESEQIDKKRLVELIAIQEGLIDRVSAILADQKYADVLKAKLPFLLSAQVFEEKKARIEPIRLFFRIPSGPRLHGERRRAETGTRSIRVPLWDPSARQENEQALQELIG